MTPEEIKSARNALGLSVGGLARMLETDELSVRRMEMAPTKSTARTPAPRMLRLIRAYLDGYRPDDWPQTQKSPGAEAPGPSGPPLE